ncbi:ATP-binding protein, partial [Bacteroides fragilis]|uniref:ATP-binding protein n=1 Tax=Bacteroides fragilis TaxID=817 RepID=UPI000AAC8EC4
RFYKINSFVQGAGLGLSVCKTIVEGLGCTINVYSQLKEGSRFSVILPLNRLHK